MIKNDHISILKSEKPRLTSKYAVQDLYLYGSYARNKATQDSDIDIAVRLPKEKKSFRLYISLKDELTKTLGAEIDLVFIDSMNPIIKYNFKKEAIKIEP